jgi:hypothetical protein
MQIARKGLPASLRVGREFNEPPILKKKKNRILGNVTYGLRIAGLS